MKNALAYVSVSTKEWTERDIIMDEEKQ